MKKKLRFILYQTSAISALLFGRKRRFMNLGYDTEDNTIINITDQKDYHHISLYMKLLNMVPGINDVGKNWSALEFGCGRGGGCYVMENYYGISKITGIDLSSANIKFASKFLPKIRFITTDATTFNAEEKFDLILNLESSHAYSSRLEFFKKVKLSMHNTSFFAFGDIIKKENLEEVELMVKDLGFVIIKKETINERVVKSIKKNSIKQYFLPTKFPFLFPRKLHSFFVTIHSRAFYKLTTKDVLYQLYLIQKKI